MCKTPRSNLAFSQVREDWQIEWQVLDLLEQRQSRPLRVLLVGSGGCTALSLLAHPGIERVDAVDANPTQLHLIVLRQQALQHLSIDEQWLLLATGDEAQAQVRLAIYDRLHPNLPMATQKFWQERRQEIAYGVNQVGRFEQLFRSLAIAFEQAGLDPLNHPQEAVASPQWLRIFEQVFERERLIDLFGPAAVDYSMDRSFGEHFARVFAQALQRFAPQDNYFLTQVWADRYAESAEGRPAYLQAQYLPAIQANLSKLHLHLRNSLLPHPMT
jgi:S-adenosylmethionine-diacylglycerol 3-amino-3-carboxypropyl transferase